MNASQRALSVLQQIDDMDLLGALDQYELPPINQPIHIRRRLDRLQAKDDAS